MSMTVCELIAELSKLPPDAKVSALYGGVPRLPVEMAYLSKSGRVILAEVDSVCYENEDRPEGAPPKSESMPYYWLERPV